MTSSSEFSNVKSYLQGDVLRVYLNVFPCVKWGNKWKNGSCQI